MHFNTIGFAGFRPFLGETGVDFDKLPGRIVALIGKNGDGKTRFLELLAGGIYRAMPTRGKLAALAADRKTFLQVTATTDQTYTFRQIIDGHSGRSEAVVVQAMGPICLKCGQPTIAATDAAEWNAVAVERRIEGLDFLSPGQRYCRDCKLTGVPLTDSAKLPEFDAWVARNMPAPEVLFATMFAPQGDGGFFGLSKADRKSVMLRALLIEHYEALAEAARAKLRDAGAALEITLAKFNELSALHQDIDVLVAEEKLCDKAEAAAAKQLATARAELQRLRTEAQRVAVIVERNSHVRANATALDLKIEQLTTALAGVDERAASVESILSRRSEIETAVADLLTLDDLITKRTAERDELIRQVSAWSEKIAGMTADINAADLRRRNASTRAVALRLRIADREALEKSAGKVDVLRVEVAVCEADSKNASQALRELRATALDDKDVRIYKLRVGFDEIEKLDPVHDAVAGAITIAGETKTADDDSVKTAAAMPAKLAAAERAEQAAFFALEDKRTDLRAAETAAAKLAELNAATDDLKAAETEVAEAELDMARIEQKRDDALVERKTADDARIGVQAALDVETKRRREVAGVAAEQGQITYADTRKTELAAERTDLVAQHEKALAERAGIKVEQDPDPVDTSDAELNVSSFEIELQQATAAASTARSALAAARELAGRLQALAAQRRHEEIEVADYTRLAFELGRDGLQALEIDAAGPELTELVNDLLHNCFGNRWTVEIETVREAKSGKKQIEVFDGIVHDREEGDKTFEQLSGGQKVIIGEAFSLALTMIACGRSGITRPMLIRDETGAALDAETGPAYVAMLRRAADIVNASKVIFVSHNAELHALADSRLYIVKGAVRSEDEAGVIYRLEDSFADAA